jgi:hypothetical protein
MARPTAVTVVCWVIIALSLEGLMGMAAGLAGAVFKQVAPGSAVPLSKAMWLGVGGVIVNIILAALMLRGFGWPRFVYFAFAIIGILGFFVIKPPAALVVSAVVKAIVFAYFLFRHDANEYFSSPTQGADQPPPFSA